MAKFLVSPTEEDLTQLLGEDAITSSMPEEKGADILIYSKQGLYGAQRKKLPHDFILSFQDGRMTRETSLLPKECKFYEMICEGRFRYFPDGRLAVDRKEPSRFTRRQIRGILFNVKYIKGVPVEYTEDLADTVSYLRWMHSCLNEEKHLGLFRRPSIQSAWYVPTVDELHSWIMQSWQGIGPATAEAVIKRFGGIPLKWTCTLAEMMTVPRLSKDKAREMINTLAMEHKAAEKQTYPSNEFTKQHDEFERLRDRLRRGT